MASRVACLAVRYMIWIPGLGAITRAITGWVQSQQLSNQIEALTQLASQDSLSLVPQSFRKCAELRLMLAQMDAKGTVNQKQMAKQFVSQFESVREEAVRRMMEDASNQTATKADIIKLVHTLEDYARACQGDLEKQSSRSDTLESSLSRLRAETDSAIQGIKNDILSQTNKVEALNSTLKQMRIWLIVLLAFLVLEGAATVYLLLRM